MFLSHFLWKDWLNTRRKAKKKSCKVMQGNDMQGNVNLPVEAITESLLCLTFQRQKYKGRIIIAHIKSL